MKKTQLLELLKNIKKTRVSFLSVLIFVALGVAVYTGMGWAGHGILKSFDEQFEKQNMEDLEISFPLGVSDEELDMIRAIDGVDEVIGSYTAYETFEYNDGTYQAKMEMLADGVNTPYNITGELPKEQGEVALIRSWARSHNVSIGDTITIVHDDDGTAYALYYLTCGSTEELIDSITDAKIKECGVKALTTDTFTVTGYFDSPVYINNSTYSFGVSPTTASVVDCVMFVAEPSFDAQAFTGYSNIIIRSDNLRSARTYQDKYADIVAELSARVSDVSAEIASVKAGIVTEEFNNLTSAAENLLDAAEAIVADPDSGINDAESLLEGISASLEQDNLSEAAALVEGGQALIDANREEIDAAIKTDGAESVEEAREVLQNTINSFSTMFKYLTCTVTTRENNLSYGTAKSLVSVFLKLRYSLASLFVVVGMLVCYSALSRIIYEQIVQIGTKKALGLGAKSVTMSYLLYSAAAALVGIIIGLPAGTFIVEPIIIRTLSGAFLYEKATSYFSVTDALLISALEIALVVGASYIACRKVLRRSAVTLLQGPQPPSGKERRFERTAFWKKLPLFTKTVINNCLNDKRRVAATLIGVAGCTALVVSAFTMNNNVEDSLTRQFSVIQDFDITVSLDSSVEGAAENVKSVLAENGIESAAVYSGIGALRLNDGTAVVTYVYSPCDDNLYNVLHLYKSGKRVANEAKDNVWISRAYARECDLGEGDTFTLISSSGARHELTIEGVFEYYLTRNLIVMSPETYEREFGAAPQATLVLVCGDGRTAGEIDSLLQGTAGYKSSLNYKNANSGTFNMFASVSGGVMAIYVLLSVVMAVLVILNLLVMFIEEKKKELIVLMINGFDVKYAKRYIYSDTIFLTIIGIILGEVLGCFMGFLATNSFESGMSHFLHTVNAPACLIGAGVSAGLTVIMCLIALRRIEKFSLTEINRD